MAKLLVGLPLLVAVLWVVTACQGPTQPLSAQQGSSILIPVGSTAELDADLIGYGTPTRVDGQRGALQFFLTDTARTPLVTRATSLVEVAGPSRFGRDGLIYSQTKMVVSLVDIPTTAPLGTYGIDIERHRTGESPVDLPYAGEIKILPLNISVMNDQSLTEIITGTPSVLKAAASTGGVFGAIGATANQMIPDPMLVLVPSESVHAVHFWVTYAHSVINVVDVHEEIRPGRGTTHPAMISFEDNQNGVLEVKAVSASTSKIDSLALVFTLDNQAVRFDPTLHASEFTVLATDEDGQPIPNVTFAESVE